MQLKLLSANAKQINLFLKRYLNKQNRTNLLAPMRYGVLFGGKKIRSSIIFGVGKLYGISKSKLKHVCGAVECIHSYSLIHDDLPCMDDDKTRRGKPSTHIKFGEANAVLAGNSLLTLGFEMISGNDFIVNSKIKNLLIKELAFCAGHSGIAGGQELDLRYEKKNISLNKVIEMQRKKTGKLFNFCCYAPTLLANKKKSELKLMSKFGEDIGLLFQITDDLLDRKGKKKKIGKSTGKDKKKGKSTLISLLGVNNTIKFAKELRIKILRKLKKHGKKANELEKTINFVFERNF